MTRAQQKDGPASAVAFEYDLHRRKIDVHWHIGSWGVNERRLSLKETLEDFSYFGYEFAVISSIKAIQYDLAAGNAETASWLDKDPRCRGYVVIDPTRWKESLSEIDKYVDHPAFVGLKTAACYYQTTLSDERYRPLLRRADQLAWPLLTHKFDLDRVAARYPRISFIAAHSLIADVKKLSRHPNVYFDIAASYAHRAETDIEGMVSTVGARRILFGTDAQLMSPSWSIGKISSSRLSDEDKDRLFYRNAFDLFRQFRRRTHMRHRRKL